MNNKEIAEELKSINEALRDPLDKAVTMDRMYNRIEEARRKRIPFCEFTPDRGEKWYVETVFNHLLDRYVKEHEDTSDD
jgi:hypothetical protein